MSLDDWQIVFIFVCIIFVGAACASTVSAFLPRREEPFFSLGLLDGDGMAGDFYPENNSDLKVGIKINWTIYMYNHMGRAEYVAIRVKLINSTTFAPNTTLCIPCSSPFIYEIRRVLLDNETLLCPFSWSIKEAEKVGNFVYIKNLLINDEFISTSSVAENGYNFRIIIELWLYDQNSKNFQFGWIDRNESHCTWNQIWFNSTLVHK